MYATEGTNYLIIIAIVELLLSLPIPQSIT